eukprot:3553225-Rhodomonas_salina.1
MPAMLLPGGQEADQGGSELLQPGTCLPTCLGHLPMRSVHGTRLWFTHLRQVPMIWYLPMVSAYARALQCRALTQRMRPGGCGWERAAQVKPASVLRCKGKLNEPFQTSLF